MIVVSYHTGISTCVSECCYIYDFMCFRTLVFGHRQALAGELREELDAAMVLHLAAVLLFQVHTGCMLHAPGRCVPNIVSFLQDKMPAQQHGVLVTAQGQDSCIICIHPNKDTQTPHATRHIGTVT